MARKLLTVVLPKDEYAALVELADCEERTAPQQATYLVRQAINTLSRRKGNDKQNAVRQGGREEGKG